MDALREAGDMLAEAMRAGLTEKGLPDTVEVIAMGGRVIVATRSRAVRDAERGYPGHPPTDTLSTVARHCQSDICALLAKRLSGMAG